MAKITAPRGTKDILPSESYKWQYIENVLRTEAAAFGYKEIRFPTFEHTELFLRGVGETTDVVQKEMYTFRDKGGRSITLRPEGTASVVRSYIENSIFSSGLPVKVYYIAPNFRYEKPQAGRLREHHQFGAEHFGSTDASADAELIALADAYLKRLGIKDYKLEINSIGCPECRPAYHAALKSYFSCRKEELCGTCLERLEKNPLRILDCKSPVCGNIANNAPKCIDSLCADCSEHMEKVRSYLEALNIPYTVNPRIVRGLDYYTRTVFEFSSGSLGAQSAICAGGRYDGLVETLGGEPTAGLGFGSGIERLLMVMEAQGIRIPDSDRLDVFLCALGDEAFLETFKLTNALRELGIRAERDTLKRSLKAQMKYADKLGARYTIVLGSEELEKGIAVLRNMESGEKKEIMTLPEAIAREING
ncbi:MAG: histidine--tRNA ligase [Clostridiales bacterium]|nr:histidine--tRNA ligase [Clostridiales bacterium]